MFKSLLNLLFFFLCPVISLAQGRIGNGGGLGEMRALTAFENMPQYIESTLLKNNLNDSDQEKLRLVLKNHPIEKNIGGIEFYISEESSFSSILTKQDVGSRIYINSKLLANERGKPYEIKIIARYVLYGLLLHHTNHDQAFKLSELVFQGVSENSVQVGFTYNLNFYSIHQFKIFDPLFSGKNREEVYFELPNKSLILNSFLTRDLNCYGELHWNIEKMFWLKESEAFIFDMEWSCESMKNGYAKVILNFLPNEQNALDQESLKFKTIGIISPR